MSFRSLHGACCHHKIVKWNSSCLSYTEHDSTGKRCSWSRHSLSAPFTIAIFHENEIWLQRRLSTENVRWVKFADMLGPFHTKLIVNLEPTLKQGVCHTVPFAGPRDFQDVNSSLPWSLLHELIRDKDLQNKIHFLTIKLRWFHRLSCLFIDVLSLQAD